MMDVVLIVLLYKPVLYVLTLVNLVYNQLLVEMEFLISDKIVMMVIQ